MNIFDYLSDIQTIKSCSLPLEGYSPYMLNRWMSFYSTSLCNEINESCNTYSPSVDKQYHYILLASITPKSKYSKRITYIKKTQEKEDKNAKNIEVLARNAEMSQREYKQLLEFKQNVL